MSTQVTAKMVMDLRERTGVGMMECKKALVAANGDIDAAIEALRKAGQASAVKKGGRIAADGLIAGATAADGKSVQLVEVNSETDFVARENSFKQFCKLLADTALSTGAATVEDLSSSNVLGKEQDVENARLELVAQLGENLVVRRLIRVAAPQGGAVALYLHGGDGSTARIGTIVALDVDNVNLARDVAMHIAGMKPEYLVEADVPVERIEKEREIETARTLEKEAGKPMEMIERIVAGSMGKFLKEITLLNQSFVKDPSITVGKLLDNNKAKVVAYTRFEVGEGIEKKATDFVGEVMAQVRGG